MRGIGICQWVAGIFILALAGPAWALEKNVLLASKDANQAVIVIASESNPGAIIAATRLQEYVT